MKYYTHGGHVGITRFIPIYQTRVKLHIKTTTPIVSDSSFYDAEQTKWQYNREAELMPRLPIASSIPPTVPLSPKEEPSTKE